MVILTDKTYDVAKKIAQIWLPALGALYFSLSQIWGLPNGEQVVGTITVIDVFLGVVLGISQNTYEKTGMAYDGDIVIQDGADPGDPKVATFAFNKSPSPQEMLASDKFVLKVVDQTTDDDFWGDSQ